VRILPPQRGAWRRRVAAEHSRMVPDGNRVAAEYVEECAQWAQSGGEVWYLCCRSLPKNTRVGRGMES